MVKAFPNLLYEIQLQICAFPVTSNAQNSLIHLSVCALESLTRINDYLAVSSSGLVNRSSLWEESGNPLEAQVDSCNNSERHSSCFHLKSTQCKITRLTMI